MRLGLFASAGLLVSICACGGRPATLVDSGTRSETRISDGKADGIALPDGARVDSAVPAACTTLSEVGHVLLEWTDAAKAGQQIAFDGERFAVIWHSQPGVVSSMDGELRFALVDAAAKTDTPQGISVGTDEGSLRASIVAAPGDYAVLHRRLSQSGFLTLERVAATGQPLSTTTVGGSDARQAAMTSHPKGYALLLAETSPTVVVVDKSGAISAPTVPWPSAEMMASLWLAPRPSGFAAAYHSMNSNAQLLILDQSFNKLQMTSLGQGGTISSPSFAATSTGFAALYVRSSTQVELELYSASGQALSRHPLGTFQAPLASVGDTALVWTGSQLIAAYPKEGPVGRGVRLHLLSSSGVTLGSPVELPSCVGFGASGVSMAWGNGRLAVASIAQGSGLPNAGVCVTVMECQ